MSYQTVPPSYAQASILQHQRYTRFVHLLRNEPYQQTLLTRITNPLDHNILSNTHTLLGLRKVHTDAVAKIDFLLNLNTNRLFDDLYPVLQPNEMNPTVPPPVSSSPSQHFSPMNTQVQSSSTPAAPRRVPRKKAPNPYPI